MAVSRNYDWVGKSLAIAPPSTDMGPWEDPAERKRYVALAPETPVDPERMASSRRLDHHASRVERGEYQQRRMREAAATAFDPPAWLTDPSLLPKRPPGAA